MLIPYPITTSPDGRPIQNSKTIPGMVNKGQQNKVGQSDPLLSSASSGATGTDY